MKIIKLLIDEHAGDISKLVNTVMRSSRAVYDIHSNVDHVKPIRQHDYHVTILTTSDNQPDVWVELTYPVEVRLHPSNLQMWEADDGMVHLVIPFGNVAISQRRSALLQRLSTNRHYPQYQPHLSLAYNVPVQYAREFVDEWIEALEIENVPRILSIFCNVEVVVESNPPFSIPQTIETNTSPIPLEALEAWWSQMRN